MRRLWTLVFFFSIGFLILPLFLAQSAKACNGTDVLFSDSPAGNAAKKLVSSDGSPLYFDSTERLLLPSDTPQITPSLAQAIATKFVSENYPDALPLAFRKLEYVHGKLIYQFQSGKIDGINVKYHLGPVNFIVDYLVLDVDSLTGNLYIADGCGAAPGELLYAFNPNDFDNSVKSRKVTLIPDNTNFIARNTGHTVHIDGIIGKDEWSNTGHRYFYLGNYVAHKPSAPHKSAMYYAEVWAQTDGKNMYMAIKTDTPYWVAVMLKGDDNLGMLGAYTDAKLVKSDGEVTDRHFTVRKNGTFYLAPDKNDNIISSGMKQKDFYTYEFAFPLASDDKEDVSLKMGRAYNMLLVVGNTLEHYGIFTLDPAHKNHKHSQNNREHVDVWASNETTLRIGDPANRDIFDNPVTPVLAGYTSGYDPAKSNTHFHYANLSLQGFALRGPISLGAGITAIIFSIMALAFMVRRFKPEGEAAELSSSNRSGPGGIDLLRNRFARRFAESKYFRASFIIPIMLIFLTIIVLGFVDVQDGRRNIATVYTWSLWWTLIIFSFIALGRFWCMMCPFAAVGDFFQKLFSFNKELPPRLRNMGLQALGFIVLTLLFTFMHFPNRPFVTSVVILTILAAAVIFSIIYRRRTFCRHLCPIGAVIGLYSTVSPVEVVAKDRGRCDRHATKTCTAACPMLETPYEKDGNLYCNLCMKCLSACPSRNLTVALKAPGSSLISPPSDRSWANALASMLLLGVIMVETLAMTSIWQPLKSFTATLLHGAPDQVVYLTLFTAVVFLPSAVFFLLTKALGQWSGMEKAAVRDMLARFAFAFIPLGVSLHLAHNMHHLMLEGPVAFPATLRLLEGLGFHSPWTINWNPSPLLQAKWLFFMQMSILMVGFGFTLVVLYRTIQRYRKEINSLSKYATALAVYALIVVLANIYMLGLPMSGRHVH